MLKQELDGICIRIEARRLDGPRVLAAARFRWRRKMYFEVVAQRNGNSDPPPSLDVVSRKTSASQVDIDTNRVIKLV